MSAEEDNPKAQTGVEITEIHPPACGYRKDNILDDNPNDKTDSTNIPINNNLPKKKNYSDSPILLTAIAGISIALCLTGILTNNKDKNKAK